MIKAFNFIMSSKHLRFECFKLCRSIWLEMVEAFSLFKAMILKHPYAEAAQWIVNASLV